MGDARVSLTQPTLQPGLACLTTGEREVRGRDGKKGGGKEGGRERVGEYIQTHFLGGRKNGTGRTMGKLESEREEL